VFKGLEEVEVGVGTVGNVEVVELAVVFVVVRGVCRILGVCGMGMLLLVYGR